MEIQRLIDAYAKAIISDDEIQPMIVAKRERSNVLDAEIDKLRNELASTPSEEVVKQRAEKIEKAIKSRRIGRKRVNDLYQHNRKMIESAFEGRDADGKRLGVYLRKVDEKIFYEIRGNLPFVNQGGELYSDETARLLGLEETSSGGRGSGSPALSEYKTASHSYTPTVSRSGL